MTKSPKWSDGATCRSSSSSSVWSCYWASPCPVWSATSSPSSSCPGRKWGHRSTSFSSVKHRRNNPNFLSATCPFDCSWKTLHVSFWVLWDRMSRSPAIRRKKFRLCAPSIESSGYFRLLWPKSSSYGLKLEEIGWRTCWAVEWYQVHRVVILNLHVICIQDWPVSTRSFWSLPSCCSCCPRSTRTWASASSTSCTSTRSSLRTFSCWPPRRRQVPFTWRSVSPSNVTSPSVTRSRRVPGAPVAGVEWLSSSSDSSPFSTTFQGSSSLTFQL